MKLNVHMRPQKKSVILDKAGRISLTLNNAVMADFIQYIQPSKYMKDYNPLASSVALARLKKFAGIMTGFTVWEIYLASRAKYERYSLKPEFKIILTKGQASAILLYMELQHCSNLVLHTELMQIDQFI